MPCSTVFSLTICISSSAYFTVWIICPPMLESPSPSRAFFVRHSLYKLNRIGDKLHPCITPLPICTLFVSPRSSHTLTFWSMYNLLINLLSCQSIQFSLGSELITIFKYIYMYIYFSSATWEQKKTSLYKTIYFHVVLSGYGTWLFTFKEDRVY